MEQILSIAKVFFYIFVLMLALTLLKGLSTFEYSLRDKSLTYNEVLSMDFKTDNKKGLINRLRNGNSEPVDSLLKLDMGVSNAVISSKSIDGIALESQDSGYIELRYRAELHPATAAELVWRNKTNSKMSIQKIDAEIEEFLVVKSDLISFSDFSELEVIVDEAKIKQHILQDSMLSAQEPFALGHVYMDYVKFIAELKQKPLF